MSVFSEVKVWKNEKPGSKLLARGSFVVAGAVKVNFAYINGAKGPYVMLPADKDQNGKVDEQGRPKYYPHAKFITKEAVREVNDLVRDAYNGGTSGDSQVQQTQQTHPTPYVDDLPF